MNYDGNYALLGSIAFMAASALVLGIAAWIVSTALIGLWHEPLPSGLGAMLARQGIDWGAVAASASINEVAHAADRCAACRARAQCGEWLVSGRRDGYAAFCPNAAFVERVTRIALR
jgi:hypothetical protein